MVASTPEIAICLVRLFSPATILTAESGTVQTLGQKPPQGFVGAIFAAESGSRTFSAPPGAFALRPLFRCATHGRTSGAIRELVTPSITLASPITDSRWARAEQRGAEANFRGALFDGDFEIVAHAHGQDWKGLAMRRATSSRSSRKPAKKWADSSGSVEERRNGHQAAQLRLRKVPTLSASAGRSASATPLLVASPLEMDFDQHAELLVFRRRGGVEALRERQAIDGVDAVEKPRGARGFVALQVADQVPRGARDSASCRGLALEFLNAILAEVAQAGFVGGKYGLGRKCFGRPRQVISSARRPARCAARAMRSRIRAKFAAMRLMRPGSDILARDWLTCRW